MPAYRDRIELLQDGQGLRFRDRDHTRLIQIAAEGAPRLREIALYIIPDNFTFDVTEPWELQLLVQRSTGVRDKATLPYDLGYTLPERYLIVEAAPVQAAAQPAAAPTGEASGRQGRKQGRARAS